MLLICRLVASKSQPPFFKSACDTLTNATDQLLLQPLSIANHSFYTVYVFGYTIFYLRVINCLVNLVVRVICINKRKQK